MKERLLALLKEKDQYISGEEIGSLLGVSRSAVWKNVKSLRNEGYEIQAVTNKGYKLLDFQEVYNAAEIKACLNTEAMGKKIVYLNTITSTNDKARTLGFDGEADGTVVISDEQTAGKGRRGNGWSAPPGSGIWMSILVRPDILPQNVPNLTLIVGMSVCDVINRMYNVNAGVKWPNDILINSKKICGILVELVTEITFVNFAVIGVGINVNTENFPAELGGVATSLMLETGQKSNRNKLVAAILEEFEKNYKVYIKDGFAAFKTEYEKRCITLNKRVHVHATKDFDGVAVGITDAGLLLVKNELGQVVTLIAGDVSIREVK